MFSKASPAPRNPIARSPGLTALSDVDASFRKTISAARRTEKSIAPQTVVTQSTPRSHVNAEVDGGNYSLSELILPFHLDIAARLMKQQGQEGVNNGAGDHLKNSDLMELQSNLDDYAEGLIYSARQLLMHDNESMVRRLQETRDVPTTRLFLQMQREMRQFTGDDSPAGERRLIESLSDFMEK